MPDRYSDEKADSQAQMVACMVLEEIIDDPQDVSFIVGTDVRIRADSYLEDDEWVEETKERLGRSVESRFYDGT